MDKLNVLPVIIVKWVELKKYVDKLFAEKIMFNLFIYISRENNKQINL